MTGTIHLIVEDENDCNVVRAILAAKRTNIRVRPYPPTVTQGGLARLLQELDRLIQAAKRAALENDCVAVLHDMDQYVDSERTLFNQIRAKCREYGVKHVTANDELEAWLLADAGIRKWLGIKSKKCDGQRDTKEKFESLLNQKKGIPYRGRYRQEILKHLDGTGEKLSPSMQAALAHLENAPCIQD